MNPPVLIVRGAPSSRPSPSLRTRERVPEGWERGSFLGSIREPLFRRSLSRRDMLRLSGLGLGALALQFLTATERAASAAATSASSATPLPHFLPQARAVILLMQNGGPSQMDLFDPKADLKKFDGKVH